MSVLFLGTIDICTDSVYRSHLPSPTLRFLKTFTELINFATMSVEFNFDNIMYRQIDGVLVGSPVGPVLANIFVGFHEKRLVQSK